MTIKKKFDALWNKKDDLKTNITNIFQQLETFQVPIKKTGFFNKNMAQCAAEIAECKQGVLTELSNDTCTLEACYTTIYGLYMVDKEENDKHHLDEIFSYIIDKMEKEEPSLAALKNDIEMGAKFKWSY